MSGFPTDRVQRAESLALLRRLRRQDMHVGVRNSGIAFDVIMLLYEHATGDMPQDVSVDMISDLTGYSGPTVRLVLKRLIEARSVAPTRRIGKTQLYGLTERGVTGFQGYVDAVLAFREPGGVSEEAGPGPAPDPRSGP
jgi:DNA-binding transcriptional ArsR family regulator